MITHYYIQIYLNSFFFILLLLAFFRYLSSLVTFWKFWSKSSIPLHSPKVNHSCSTVHYAFLPNLTFHPPPRYILVNTLVPRRWFESIIAKTLWLKLWGYRFKNIWIILIIPYFRNCQNIDYNNQNKDTCPSCSL